MKRLLFISFLLIGVLISCKEGPFDEVPFETATEMMIMNADGTDLQLLFDGVHETFQVMPPPNDNKIVYAKDSVLYLYDLNTAVNTKITDKGLPDNNNAIEFSHDGKYLAFLASVGYGFQYYYLIDMVDYSLKNLSEITGCNGNTLDFSKSGDKLLLHSKKYFCIYDLVNNTFDKYELKGISNYKYPAFTNNDSVIVCGTKADSVYRFYLITIDISSGFKLDTLKEQEIGSVTEKIILLKDNRIVYKDAGRIRLYDFSNKGDYSLTIGESPFPDISNEQIIYSWGGDAIQRISTEGSNKIEYDLVRSIAGEYIEYYHPKFVQHDQNIVFVRQFIKYHYQ